MVMMQTHLILALASSTWRNTWDKLSAQPPAAYESLSLVYFMCNICFSPRKGLKYLYYTQFPFLKLKFLIQKVFKKKV